MIYRKELHKTTSEGEKEMIFSVKITHDTAAATAAYASHKAIEFCVL